MNPVGAASLLLLLFLARTVPEVLRHAGFWQVKEYRLDRAQAHLALRSTRRRLLGTLPLAKLTALAALALLPIPESVTLAALSVFYGGETLSVLRRARRGILIRPQPTARALAVLALTAAALASAGAVARATFGLPIVLLAVDRLVPSAVTAAVALTAPASLLRRSQLCRRARARRASFPRLTVVGVTGSYGKSSTKEFLASLLRHRYAVLKTPANANTEVGVARTILRDLTEGTAVFVCEAGAYRPGEIAAIARLISPRIAILTAVGDQHLALFGSPAALAETKAELLRALPPEGVAIVNGDDPVALRLGKMSPARTLITFGMSETSEIFASQVSVEPLRLRFRLHRRGEWVPAAVELCGVQNLKSLLAAAAAAAALGLSLAEIAEGFKSLRPLPRTMEPRRGAHGGRVIDDSYSANTAGVIAALEFLTSLRSPEKIVVLQSMIELGPLAAEAHRRAGQALGRARPKCTVLTSSDFAAEIIAGATQTWPAAPKHILVRSDPYDARRTLRTHLTPTTLLLLEGRVPEVLRRALLSPLPTPPAEAGAAAIAKMHARSGPAGGPAS